MTMNYHVPTAKMMNLFAYINFLLDSIYKNETGLARLQVQNLMMEYDFRASNERKVVNVFRRLFHGRPRSEIFDISN